ncbi:uncharacterized protein FSUBG_13360 [Fusarium subglutinans]|uniref:Mid2 domain-containing protein n=1 Tax=Gibberella subglutinans TaxID=42677 RepID=A0A8H5NYT1_GIBSU|nr:uncharacterized protein FSUBG_13360 [Fusarium subglutinans]KAF5580600.1 hypothetical protein FSUBG_13360 [Fusarium subglutinans]
MTRLGWLSWAFACLPGLIVSTPSTYLEQSIQDLNITNPEDVKHFVQEWTRPGAIKRLEFAPLASQLPTWDLPLKLLLSAAVPKPMDGAVLTTGLVAGQTLEVTAALKDRAVAELQKIQVGVLVAMLMRHAAILQSGSHLATVTETTTSWATETDTETVTTDGTTTVKTVSTIETTVSVTVSRGPTGDEPTEKNTATDSDRKHKRFVPAAPHKHLDRDAPVTKTIPPIVLRPAASLNALADGLARRGIPIHRRATDTETVYETKKATTTITDTETKTEWTTKYSTSTTTHKQTVTVFVQGQSTVTVGPTGTAASSSESGSGDGGTPKGTIIGAAVGGGLGLILIALLAFFLWRRRRKSANQTQQPSQFYAANSEAPATAQKPPPFMATTPTPLPAGARDTWASSPSRSEYSQPPAYPSPMPELANTQFAYEMHTSPQRSPQELYHPQYMSGLGLPEMRDQRRG